MRWWWAVRGAAALLASACVAPESGNPTTRCDDDRGCAAEQFCYRSYCVANDDAVVEPVADAGSPLLEFDAGLTPQDAALTVDARPSEVPDAAPVVVDAGMPVVVDVGTPVVVDAGTPVVVDAGAPVVVEDAGSPPDVGAPACQSECKPPKPDEKLCKRCVQDAYGQTPEELCGKPETDKSKSEDEDEVEEDKVAPKPLCISLCLGAANTHPSCLLACDAPTCGG